MNLLPANLKRLARANYHRRVLVVGLYLSAVLLGVFVCLLALQTARLYWDSRDAHLLRLAEEQVGNRQAFVAARNNLNVLNRRLKILRPLGQAGSPADLFGQILAGKPKGVKISSLNYSTSTDRRGTVSLAGIAATRSELLNFIEMLKKNDVFINIESPVANLIRQREVDFTITASVK
jgi:hypothetical protein